jgi:hypothetical protein
MQLHQLFKKIVLLALTFLLVATSATAQDLFKGNNLANVKVDQLTDADIAKLKTQLTSQGITIDQAEPMAIAKGMSAAEFAKLKARVAGAAPPQEQKLLKHQKGAVTTQPILQTLKTTLKNSLNHLSTL